MIGVVLDSLARVLSLSWLTGPVFDKELRVSSRRRRNYLLRWAYVSVFMLLVVLIWLSVVPKGSSGLQQSSRMAEAGQVIVTVVIWFQFLAAQALAVVMLSTAISDEIYHRTLGLLMTTPVGSLQIVLGKLLSKLLQLTLLIAISLPMLAMVRVFGGVPWEFVVYGLCLTLTTAVFYGAVSLFFSIFTRRAYVAIIQTIVTGAVLFAGLPLLAALLLRHQNVPPPVLTSVLFFSNPYFGLRLAMSWFMSGGPGYTPAWWVQCGVFLGCTAVILLLAAIFVRKAALRQVTGQDGSFSRRRRLDAAGASLGRIRRVIGAPVFWKERRSPLLGRWTPMRVIVGIGATGLLLLIYLLCARGRALFHRDVQSVFALVYVLLGLLVAAILPATSITSEKESQAWPILLTTPVSSWAIVWGKLLGALRRCLPAWGLLFGHLTLFVALGAVHPVALAQFAILAGWITVFLCGTGLYFSTRLRHTTAAVIANLAVAVGLWLAAPAVMGLVTVVFRLDDKLVALCLDMNPATQAVVIAQATGSGGRFLRYEWARNDHSGLGAAMGWMLANLAGYATVGLGFLLRAAQRVRRKPV